MTTFFVVMLILLLIMLAGTLFVLYYIIMYSGGSEIQLEEATYQIESLNQRVNETQDKLNRSIEALVASCKHSRDLIEAAQRVEVTRLNYFSPEIKRMPKDRPIRMQAYKDWQDAQADYDVLVVQVSNFQEDLAAKGRAKRTQPKPPTTKELVDVVLRKNMLEKSK